MSQLSGRPADGGESLLVLVLAVPGSAGAAPWCAPRGAPPRGAPLRCVLGSAEMSDPFRRFDAGECCVGSVKDVDGLGDTERVSGRVGLARDSGRPTGAPGHPGRAELGRFLKACRAKLKPEDVGLPPGPRRRTPGLRREEVALLAGVGITWYTCLSR